MSSTNWNWTCSSKKTTGKLTCPQSNVELHPWSYLLLELHTNGIGLFQEDGIPPKQVTQRCKLVALPFAEAPHGQFSFSLSPLDCGQVEKVGVDDWSKHTQTHLSCVAG